VPGTGQSFRRWLRATRLIQKALATPPDPLLRERPSGRVIAGLVLLVSSYLVAWPAIAVLGAAAAWLRRPKLLVAGPLLYGLSWLIFAVGLALIGKKSVSAGRAIGLTLLRKLAERHLRE
jgi:hypothetical protein